MKTLGSEAACGLDDRLLCAFAPLGAGKTEFLADKVVALVDAGADLSRVLVVVNSAEQERRFRERLGARGVDGAALHVGTPLQALLDELARTGAVLRLLTRAEFNVVLEDLKFAGFEPAVIKAMLRELRRDLAMGATGPLCAGGSAMRDVYQELRAILDALGATMHEEVPCIVLKGHGAPSCGCPFDYVLVDDAQNLSVATLKALTGLSRRQAVVAADPLQAIPGFDVGFSTDSFGTFANEAGAALIELEGRPVLVPAAVSLAQTLRGYGHEGQEWFRPVADVAEWQREALLYIKWREPSDEIAGVCRIVSNLLAADSDLLPRDIAIAVPNRAWAREVACELTCRHIAFQTLLDDDPVSGDPRSREHLGTLEAYAALALAANQDDPAAWRLWVALGRRDLGCALWAEFACYRRQTGLSMLEALQAVSASQENLFKGAGELRECIVRAFDVLAGLEGRRGFSLRNRLCELCRDPQFAASLEFFDGVEDSARLFAVLQGLSFSPSFADRPSQVSLGTYRAVSTLSPKHLFAPGLVEGVMPPIGACGADDASTLRRDAWRRALGCAVAGVRESLTLSSFQRMDAAVAQACKLPVRRVRRFQGCEVALFVRSSFIEDAGEAVSGSISGEQYFIDG